MYKMLFHNVNFKFIIIINIESSNENYTATLVYVSASHIAIHTYINYVIRQEMGKFILKCTGFKLRKHIQYLFLHVV